MQTNEAWLKIAKGGVAAVHGALIAHIGRSQWDSSKLTRSGPGGTTLHVEDTPEEEVEKIKYSKSMVNYYLDHQDTIIEDAKAADRKAA